MKKSVQEKSYEIIAPIAKELRYTLIEVEYKKSHNGMELAVCIDKENGVTLNDCETMSKALDKPLDDYDITNGKPYNLTVSSYGLNRNLKTDYDFNRFLNKEITVKFYQPYQNEKEIVCTLTAFDKDALTVNYNNAEHKLDRAIVANVKPFIKF